MTLDIQRAAERFPLEVLNEGNFELVDQLFAPDFVDHSPQAGVAPTREGIKQSMVALKTAFPDIRYTIDETIVCGDQVVSRLSATGTMKGDLLGIPATGRQASWSEIHISRGVDGRLTEHWGLVDRLGMLVQLGVVSAPGQVPVTV